MKFSRASSYALHGLAYLAGQKDEQFVPSHAMALVRGVSEPFLLKVLRPLAAAGVLQPLKGPHGGYRLDRPADKISLLDVIDAVDGPVRGRTPFDGPGGPQSGLDRRLQKVCDQATEDLQRVLAKVTLADLARNGA